MQGAGLEIGAKELTAGAQHAFRSDQGYPNSYWRSLFYFNVYRVIVATLLLVSAVVFSESLFGSNSFQLYLYGCAGYILSTVVFFITTTSRRPDFNLQIAVQVGADVFFITLLTHASGGVGSGLGLLLLASLAAAGIISRGRLTLFFASFATVAMLLEHTFEVLYRDASVTLYVQAGLLSVGYFATAWLAHTLARYTQASEQLAAQREVDLANMAQVNQLVIQDMQDGVLVVDERGVIRQINRRAVEILGPHPQDRAGAAAQGVHPGAGGAPAALAGRPGRRLRPAAHRAHPQAGRRPLRPGRTQPQRRRRRVPGGSLAHPGRSAADEARVDGPADRQYRARDPQPAVRDQPRRRAAAGGAGAQRDAAAAADRSCTTTPSGSTAWCRTC